jgi:hypothetical protein
MKTYLGYIIEESEVASIPAGPQGQQGQPQPKQNVLRNPSLMYNDRNVAYNAAQKMASEQTDPNDRAYILSYRDYQQAHVKQFVVIYNKTLLSQAPDWKERGYSIIGWVSMKDGKVTKTPDGRYVKEQQ